MKKALYLSFLFFLAIDSYAQEIRSHIIVGPNLNLAISEKSNPRIGIYSQMDWRIYNRNYFVAGLTGSYFVIKNFGGASASSVTIGWKYMLRPEKFYVNLNGGMAIETFVSRYYTSKSLSVKPMIELVSGFYIPFKEYKIDIGIAYGTYFSQFKNFSWLQLRTGICFDLKKKSKTAKETGPGLQ